MLAVSLVALFLGVLFKIISPEIDDWVDHFHHFCVHQAPQSEFRPLYRSMVCGAKLKNTQFKSSLQAMGLFHLFVVSGAHIGLMGFLLRVFLGRKYFKRYGLVILLAYVFASGARPPGVRAWAFFFITQWNRSRKLYWSFSHRLYFSVLFCLTAFSFDEIQFSLPLSWSACLAQAFGKSTLSRCLLSFLILLPLMQSFYTPSPWTVLLNATLGTLIATCLFPLTVFSFFIPSTTTICDFSWRLLFELNQLIYPYLAQGPIGELKLSFFWKMTYCLCLHVGAYSMSFVLKGTPADAHSKKDSPNNGLIYQ